MNKLKGQETKNGRRKFFRFTMFLLLVLLSACEKRVLVETAFPFEKDRIFCELVGLVGTGFIGTLTQIQPVGTPGPDHQGVKVIIREGESIIFNQTPDSAFFIFPYNIQDDSYYSLEILYKDQVITSKENQKASPFFPIETLSCQNEFIDSLDFEVATVDFHFTTQGTLQDDYYYTFNIELISNPLTPINIFGTEPAENIGGNSTKFISQRVPNLLNDTIARTTLISLDKAFYQYLKNIKLLGIIPNDDIEGHQGNLEGGIGYFGIVNYDVREVIF
jgi:hypothetical protein